MTALVLDFNAALLARKAQVPVAEITGQLVLNTDDSHSYTPEMGGKINPTKPIHVQHCYSKYSIDWLPGNNEAVREFCKKNRIKLDSLGKYEPKETEYTPFGKGVTYWHALVTYKSFDKLEAAGMTTTETLLD